MTTPNKCKGTVHTTMCEGPNPQLQALIKKANDKRSLWTKTKDFFSGAWDGTKRIYEASKNDLGDTGIGFLKGVGNLPTDVWNLAVLGSKYVGPIPPALQADTLNYAAMQAYQGGNTAAANAFATRADEMMNAGYASDLFEVKGDAEKGGAIGSMVVPFGAIAKGATTAAKALRAGKTADTAADAAKTAKTADGVAILGKKYAPVKGDAPPGLAKADVKKDGWPDLPGREAPNFKDAAAIELKEGDKIYRIIDSNSNPAGGYWARELPAGKDAWRSDYAVLEGWNKNGQYVEHVVGRDGLKVWEGAAAGQNIGNGTHFSGGGVQIWMPPGTVKTPLPPKPTGW
jgi:hypothetical protein